MRRSATVAVLAIAVLVCAAAKAAQLKPLPLNTRVIAQGEFTGFRPSGKPQVRTVTDAKTWVQNDPHLSKTQVSAQVAALHREGFVAVASEQLGSTDSNRGGLSWAMELGSVKGARAEVARDSSASNPANLGHAGVFAVAGIPSAIGLRLGGTGSGGENVLFADGRFAYLVGDGWSNGAKPAHAALIAAARKLYARVHGHPAS